jgi:hypothetical protein
MSFNGPEARRASRGIDRPNLIRLQGLATADNPLGPFTKHPLNPVLNSRHETTLFPFEEGVAACRRRRNGLASSPAFELV